MNTNEKLQAALLRYLLSPKPIRGAATRDEFCTFTRDEIKTLKHALLEVGFLQKIPGVGTSGQIYCTTRKGSKYLKELERKES